MELFLNLKLRTKILLSFAVLIMISVLTISIGNYMFSVSAIKKNTTDFSEYLIEQIGFNLEKRTADIEQVEFQQFRNTNISSWLMRQSDDTQLELERSIRINGYMNDLLYSADYFLSVMIIDTNNKQYMDERIIAKGLNKAALDSFNVELLGNKRGKGSWHQGPDGVVYMMRTLYDIPTNQLVGYIILGIDSNYIRSIIEKVDDIASGTVLILNEENELLLREQETNDLVSYYLNDYSGEPNEAHNVTFQFHGENYLTTLIATSYSKWKVVQLISVKELTRGTDSIKLWTVLTVLITLTVGFLLAMFISKSITENVRLLLGSMTRFSVDFSHKVIVPRSRDEVGMLAEKFNSMAEKIEELFNTVYREKLLKQKAEYRTLQFEYKALQAQINPHFLYNTLESIHSLAKIKGDDEIGEMVYLLGKLLRESISKKGDVIALAEELAFIRNYLALHSIIYGDKIQVQYALDETLLACQVPKFILQPLVENSIKHGIEEKPGKGIIVIRCYQETDDLVLEVVDNGIGMDEAMISRLFDGERYGTAEGEGKHTNVGILSVHKRVQILYGNHYGLKVDSVPGEGTTISVRLPMTDGE
ncbi:sensor histidine kinase [Paenibacillaceae bacterium]|nr:sensor histidine kinase [Paenibacillaceae bacterium]